MLKNTLLACMLLSYLSSCQKSEQPSPDPLPPVIPENYLVKIQTEYSYNTNPVSNYRNVDSLEYAAGGKLSGRRLTSFTNEVLKSTSRETYRFQGNQVFFSYDGIGEIRTATIEPASGYLLALNHQRNYASSPNDSILWADDAYEYDAAGFQKKHTVKVKVVNKIGDYRTVLMEDNVDSLINDGKNIVRKIYLVRKLDSTFSKSNGALVNTQNWLSRYTFTYTHTADSMVAFPSQPYQIGRKDLNMMSSETYAIERSTDGGLTWVPLSTYSKTFTHEIRNGLLQRTTVKSAGEQDMVYTYFYGQR